MKPILVDRAGDVVSVTLNRPDKLNALNHDVFEALDQTFSSLEGAKVVILQGTGTKAFSAGADIGMLAHMGKHQANRFFKRANKVFNSIVACNSIVIGAVEGYALGGGLELALCADLIVAGQGSIFGMPEIELGLMPGFGGTKRIPERVGKPLALKMMLLGMRLSQDEALNAGLVDFVVEKGESYNRALEIGLMLSKRKGEPIRSIKRALHLDPWSERKERTLFIHCFERRKDGSV